MAEESSWTPPPQNSEEEYSSLSDSEHEQGQILPTENQRIREMQLDSTEQDNAGQRRRSAQTVKLWSLGLCYVDITLVALVLDI